VYSNNSFFLLGSPGIQLFRVFLAVKLLIKQMLAFVSMDTVISRSSPQIWSVAQIYISVELLTSKCTVYIFQHYPWRKSNLTDFLCVYLSPAWVYNFFSSRPAPGNFKPDQNTHPQDFNVTPSSSHQQHSFYHELYSDVLLSRHHLLAAFKKVSDLRPDMNPKLEQDCCIYYT